MLRSRMLRSKIIPRKRRQKKNSRAETEDGTVNEILRDEIRLKFSCEMGS
jgi:hypothetical protein